MNSKVERMAELAMKLGAKNLADYGSIKSRHDFTQRQLMACLILRIYLKTTYRGFIDLLEGHTGLREVLGMTTKLPHYTTLQKFSARRDVLAVAEAMIAQMGQAALRQAGPETEVAADATGLEMTNASAHFTSRAGRVGRKWKKVSVLVVCGLLMPLGMVVADGPGSDKTQAEELLHKGFTTAEEAGVLPAKLFADAGYDADWIHGVCREVWGVQSWIKPAMCRSDGSLGGYYRPGMTERKLKKAGYGRRWNVETFFSGLKRVTGSTLSARKAANQDKEAGLRVLTYAIHL